MCMRQLVLVSLMGFLFGCNSNNADAQIKNKAYKITLNTLYKNTVPLISIAEASNLLASKDTTVYFLDTRELNEYAISHIPDAIYTGYDAFDTTALQNIPKDATVVAYCSVGYRSERIGEQLQAMGFNQVFNLYGGIFEWVNQNQTVVNNNNETTQAIHAYNRAWGIWVEKGRRVYD